MQNNSQPYNIILFLTDDHGAWASSPYGNRELKTPSLDRLAQNGMRFTDVNTPCPVSSPARACILTGQTPSQIGIHDWLYETMPEIDEHHWLADHTTLPMILNESGYHTILSGKWHLGQSGETPKGFDQCFGTGANQGAHQEEHTYVLNNKPLKISGSKTEIITNHALDFLESRPSDKPFFLNIGYIGTHSPYHESHHDPKYVDMYRDAVFSDLPKYHKHPWAKNEGFPYDESDTEQINAHRRGYYAAVSEIDHHVGRVIDYLEKTNQLENTIIIYTSDHGCTLGHHGFWGKGNSTRPLNVYETSIKVPLFIQHPELPKNHVCDRAVDHYDTFNTIMEYANVEKPKNIDYPGISYAKTFDQPREVGRFGEYGDLRFIQTDRYKLILRYNHVPNELFDLKIDPNERINQYDNHEYSRIVARLTDKIEEWYKKYSTLKYDGLNVLNQPKHNDSESWRDGMREKNTQNSNIS
ncbi:sulfatase-like hydrolase/transferase [Planctomycetota bacterium]|nr:sulfatase-like hydrolase/transferase [Planctomycetota bacterium]